MAQMGRSAPRPFRFAPPPPGPHAFLRPRLLKAVGQRWDRRVLTIEAGAGLGKTTLLAQAIGENVLDPRGRDAWLLCESGDASASTLLAGILTAVDPEGPHPAPDRLTPADVCDAVWARAPMAVCLVLDDVHHLTAGSSGAEAAATLLVELPENARMVLSGRQIPPIRRLARLHADGRADAALDAADLRMDPEELAELARRHGVAPNLLADVGGWPAIAELRASAGAAVSRQYVWEEILDGLDRHQRETFATLAAIGGGDRDLLDVVLGPGADVDAFARLPLVAPDGNGGLRPHALWNEMLGQHFSAEHLRGGRLRAAAALRDRAQFGAAFELLAAADAWDEALDMVFWACNDQRSPPPPDVVRRWLRSLPDDRREAPEALYLRAYLDRSVDPLSDATDASLRAAIQALDRPDKQLQCVVALIRWAWTGWLRRDREQLEVLNTRKHELMGSPVRELAEILDRAVIAEIDGDVEGMRAAANVLHEVRLEPRLRHFPPLFLVFADLIRGEVSAASLVPASAAASAGAGVVPAAGTGWALIAPALVHWTLGNREPVDAMRIEEWGDAFSPADRVPALALLAIAAAHRDDREAADTAMAQLLRLAGSPQTAPDLLAGFAAVASATIAASRRDEAGAALALTEWLGPRELVSSGAGRAILWFPGVAALLDRRCREFVQRHGAGPSRAPLLAVNDALARSRSGTPVAITLPPADLLLAGFPVPQAVEVAVAAAAAGEDSARTVLADVVRRAPAASRAALHGLLDRGSPAQRRYVKELLAGLAIPPPYDLRIEVLGPARVLRDGAPVDDANWRRERVRQVLCVLVAFRQIRRRRLGTLLWPDASEEAVSANLRMTLTYVQALLEPHRARGDAPWFLQQDAGMLRLEGANHLSVDAWELDAALDLSEQHRRDGVPSAELQCLQRALQLWKGEYLEEVSGLADVGSEEWAEPLRQRVRERFVAGAVRAADLLLAAGRPAAGLDAARKALAADPWSERAHQAVVRAQLDLGDRDGARRALDALERLLADLGVGPDPATVELRRRLRT